MALWVLSEHPITAPIPRQGADQLIKLPTIEWNSDGKVTLEGRYSRAGSSLNAYVTYGLTGGIAESRVLGAVTIIEPRIKIDSVSRFDRDERAQFLLGVVTNVEGNQQMIQWGRLELNNIKVGITYASYIGCVILVTADGAEDRYPFAIVSRQNVAAATVVGPPLLSSCLSIL